MATPPPTKPPRGVKYGKEEIGCGPLVTVIKTLGFSETNEERQKEKQKIEKEFKKSDQRLNELVSKYDGQLTKVLPLFSQVSTHIATSREKIHAVKENLTACKQLLHCRREELRALWVDAVQQKVALEMFEQIVELRKVPQIVTSYTNKRQYLHAAKSLTQAIDLGNGPLREIEGLTDLRTDLERRKNQLYNKLIEELHRYLYHNSTGEVLSNFQRQHSARGSKNFHRDFTRRSDRAESNARIKQALMEMSQGFDLNKSKEVSEEDLADPELSTTYFVGIIVECFAMLDKVPDSIEKIKGRIQAELLKIIANTTQEMVLIDLSQGEPEQHPLLALIDVVFKQFKVISQTHNLLLKNYLNVVQRYQLCSGSYDISDFWNQAQAALQVLLTDYLDVQNASEEANRSNFSEPSVNINSFFSRRKVQSKKTLFRFDKASHIFPHDETTVKEHRRNLSDVSTDLNLSSADDKGNRGKVLICKADPALIRKIYVPLLSYINEIEEAIKCKPGQQSSLNAFVRSYIKDTFLSKGHNRNLQLTIDSLSKNHDAWKAIITPEDMNDLNLTRPLLLSTVTVERQLTETKTLIQDLPDFSDDLLKMACALLKTYRETCQAAYRGIVQPDAEDKRIYSVAWLKDDDINRFLKTLPNWTDLKTSSARAKSSRRLRKSGYEQSEEESPLQIQQRNIREAEMLTSNLGEGGISQQEILSDIGVLKELATLQESMEWFSTRISEFANDLRRPGLNGVNVGAAGEFGSVSIKDGTIKVLTNLALEFDELANTCLLVLHLEVRVQCFHYLRGSSSRHKSNSFMSSQDVDSLEADPSVQRLTRILSEMDEAFTATLHPRKTRYIFEGLAHLASRILIQASNSIETIDEANIQRMCRNALAMQQTLSSITATREVALDQARNFYELLCMGPDDILTSIIEKGSQFTEMQYLNALQLSAKSRGITDLNSLASFQQKLSDILGAKPTKGVVV